MERFADQLRHYIKRKGLKSLRAFDRLVSTGGTFVNHVASGDNTPPLDQMPAWADALDLHGAERRDFLVAAALEHAPEVVRTEFLRLHNALKKYERMELNRRNQEQQHQQRLHQVEPTPFRNLALDPLPHYPRA